MLDVDGWESSFNCRHFKQQRGTKRRLFLVTSVTPILHTKNSTWYSLDATWKKSKLKIAGGVVNALIIQRTTAVATKRNKIKKGRKSEKRRKKTNKKTV